MTTPKKTRVALLGCGALSHLFAENLTRALGEDFVLTAAYCRDEGHRAAFADTFHCRAAASISDLLADAPDYVVEFAGGAALKACAVEILEHTNLIGASAGALADTAFFDNVKEAARTHGTRFFVPGGAIGGLDVLQSFALMGNCDFSIETRKAPGSLEGAPGLAGRTLSREREELVFEGTPTEAIKQFPKNVNVAVASSLAAGAAAPKLILRSIPGATTTTHHIRVANDLSHVELTFTSRPDPANPRSSTSTAWSVLALLKNLTSPVAFY